ncbi:MAG: response regulator transcription factor [Phenylobacterium sp.]|nr:response regulator transcription factor [Phenylobacterium sp.]
MWRALLVAGLLALAPAAAGAQGLAWESCRAERQEGPPRLADCRAVEGPIDPQGRELWLRAAVPPRRSMDPKAVFAIGVASSEVWFNGVRLGANGRPGAVAEAEIPGRYHFDVPIPETLWRPAGNELVVHMSAFHGGLRFVHPVGWLGVGAARQPSPLPLLAVTFVAAGALAAAAFGFGAIHAMRRTGSSLALAALSGVAALQAAVEMLRHLWRYPYPVHSWRVTAIWLLTVAFAALLAAWAGSRFAPRRRPWLLAAAAIALPATWLLPGFDVKAGVALLAGVGLAGVAAAEGVVTKVAGARPTLAWLATFMALGVLQPIWLLDLSFFVFAATLVLPLLIVEVLRLGRDDTAREAALTRAASRPDRLTVASPRGVELVPLPDILAIVGADDYAELRLRGGRSLLHAARLERLETQLPSTFLRVHRSVIANLAHVERLEREGGRWRLHLSEGPPLPVSRSRLAAVRDALDAPQPLRAIA